MTEEDDAKLTKLIQDLMDMCLECVRALVDEFSDDIKNEMLLTLEFEDELWKEFNSVGITLKPSGTYEDTKNYIEKVHGEE